MSCPSACMTSTAAGSPRSTSADELLGGHEEKPARLEGARLGGADVLAEQRHLAEHGALAELRDRTPALQHLDASRLDDVEALAGRALLDDALACAEGDLPTEAGHDGALGHAEVDSRARAHASRSSRVSGASR